MKAPIEPEPKKVDLRVVDVVARYEMKRHGKPTGVVVYEVRPSEKTLERDPETPDYRVTFLDGIFQSCTCKCGLEWGKTPKCYHALQLIERERERHQEKQDITAKVAQVFNTPTLPRQREEWGDDVSTKGTLSSNRGFSLMR